MSINGPIWSVKYIPRTVGQYFIVNFIVVNVFGK